MAPFLQAWLMPFFASAWIPGIFRPLGPRLLLEVESTWWPEVVAATWKPSTEVVQLQLPPQGAPLPEAQFRPN